METDLRQTDVEPYRGRRWAIRRALGEDRAALVLHWRFEGNATAAAEFLGFRSRTVLSGLWVKHGLEIMGRESNRKHAIREADNPYSDETTDELHWRLLNMARAPSAVRECPLHVPDGQPYALLVPIADVHMMSPQCRYDKLVALLDWIEEREWVYWFVAGDLFDMAIKGSVGSVSEQTCSVTAAMQLMSQQLARVKDRCLGIGAGNHDLRLRRYEDLQWDPATQVAMNLGVPALGYCEHLTLLVGEQEYSVYYSHGQGASRTPGARLNAGLRVLGNVRDELVIVGHLHEELTRKVLSVEVKDGRLTTTTQRLVMCPSFLGYGGYAEEKALPPAPLGVTAIELYAHEHQIRVVE